MFLLFFLMYSTTHACDCPITTSDLPASHMGIIRASPATQQTKSFFERIILYFVQTISKPTGIINLITVPCAIGIDVAAPLMRLLCTLVGYERDQSYLDLNNTRVHETCMQWHAHDFELLFMRIMDNARPFAAHHQYAIIHCYPLYQFPGFIDLIKRFPCYQATIRDLYARMLSDKQFMLHIEELPGISPHQLLVIVERYYHELNT